MSVNSSSFLNVTLTPPLVLSSLYKACLKSLGSVVLFVTYTLINIFLVFPLYVIVLYMGFQRWRHEQTTSHSDFFTYNMIALEIFGVLGSSVYCLGISMTSTLMLKWGMIISCIIFPGQTLFHTLTCVERYLAVVHPVTFLRLRETGGVRIRNISIVCAWLLCFGYVGLTIEYLPYVPFIPILCILGVSVIVICFCCLSVLCVLVRPGPGDGSGDKDRVDQSKQRAFHIIRAIMGALLLRFFGLLFSFGLSYVQSIALEDLCALIDAGIFLSLPSSLVLPLLFLHKAGKLACCRCKTESR